MTRYLLDTNVISNITKPGPSESLLEWMGVQSDGDLFISSLTVAEIRRGILDKPKGKKRERLEAWFAGPEGPQSLFKGRILPFDEKAALVWARLMSEGRAARKPRSDLDMIVAAVAETNECVIVTDNEKHFSGLDVLIGRQGDGFLNTGDWQMPVTPDCDDAEPEAKRGADERRWADRQFQHIGDHHDRRTRQRRHSV